MADSRPPSADSHPQPRRRRRQLSIEKIYVKDLSLENPGSAKSFQMTESPQIEIGLRTRGEQVAPDVYECVLTLTVTARAGRQDGVPRRSAASRRVRIRGVRRTRSSRCWAFIVRTVLFPYARETDRRCDAACRLSRRCTCADQLRGAVREQLAQSCRRMVPAVTN
jgi:protein-export chaperone SecB